MGERALVNLAHMMVIPEEEEEVNLVHMIIPVETEMAVNPDHMTGLEKVVEATPKDTKGVDLMVDLALERAVVNRDLMTEVTQRVTREMAAIPTDIKEMEVILMMDLVPRDTKAL